MTRGSAHKVMLLGAIGVGKSSIAQRLLFGRFSQEYKPTIGVEVYRYEAPAGFAGGPMSLILWDTDGNFGDAIFRHVYIKEAAAAVIVGDSTRPDTINQMVHLAAGFADVFPGRAIHFLLNKCDLLSELSQPALPGGLKTWPVLQTSALSGENVTDAFLETAKAVRRRGL
jgi:small GTP-binding protein